MKTSELTGAALDWAVLEALKPDLNNPDKAGISTFGPLFGKGYRYPSWGTRKYSPSTDWSQGGPIIDLLIAEKFQLMKGEFGTGFKCIRITPSEEVICMFGPTPLIAAMRCYVASKLGEEVDIPEELL